MTAEWVGEMQECFFFQSSVVPQPVSGEFSIISSFDFQSIHAVGVGMTRSHKIGKVWFSTENDG